MTTTANSKRQTSKPGALAAAATADPFDGTYTFRSLAMTCEILDLVALLPNDRVTGVVSNQILRSASSIAANIAEGHGRYAPGAYRNHLSIARGSTEETISWIDLMARRGMIVPEQEASALRKCAELMKMLTAKMVQLSKAVSRPNALGEEPAAYDVEAFDV